MASVAKYTDSAVCNILRHSERTIATSKNADIEPTRTIYNYKLSPDRGISDYDYYRRRKSEVYVYGRADVKTLAGWVVTLPQGATPEQAEPFFRVTYDFLADRYGADNVISAVVHNDESGQPHLHFNFMPITYDFGREREKICANEVLDRAELRNIHGQLQKYLDNNGLSDLRVYTGVTTRNGRNYTVEQLKQGALERTHTIDRDRGVHW